LALDTLYSIGTISVGAGSTTVTGVGTAWITSNTRAGDDFRAAGLVVPIASIDSATQITLARPWPGAVIAAGNYDIRQIDDGARALTAANIMRQSLGSGTLTSLAALTSGANLLPYWSGVGVMATTPVSAAARTLLAAASAAAMRDVLGVGTPEDYATAEDVERIEGGLTLAALAASKAVTAVDVLVYDTSRDTDGGAWRKRCQHTSWWNETLNTATRGARREFPAVAVIVAEAAKITIHDGDDPALPMWRVLDFTGYSLKAIAARNGQIAVALAANGLSVLDLPGDALAVSPRFTTATTPAIVSNATHDVAMTVLPGAPADPVTGLPAPTIALATAAGVSVIKDDGNVWDSASVATHSDVGFTAKGELFASYFGEHLRYYANVSKIVADGFVETAVIARKTGGTINGPFRMAQEFAVGVPAFGGNGTDSGLTLLRLNQVSVGGSLLAAINASYSTGWMVGATKGAFLSSTDSAALVGSGELVTNGTFDTDLTGWTAATPETVLTHNAGRIRVASNTAGVYGKAAATIPTVIGKTYVLQLEGFAGTGAPYVYVGSSAGASNYAAAAPSAGPITFVALSATTHITLFSSGALGAFYSEYDNVSVKLADPDRSTGARGIIAQGTLTRTAVATGAQLMGYSGWSAANYLEQPYNPTLDFGTGDFCVMGWVNASASGVNRAIVDRSAFSGAYSGAAWRLRLLSGGNFSFQVTDDGYATSDTLTSIKLGYEAGNWVFVVAGRIGANLFLSVNGAANETTAISAAAGTLSNASAVLTVGKNPSGDILTDARLALWRIGATAPTAEQIRKIYEDEKALFQPGAQCTLYGASDAVTALAEDPVTSLLHVGTSAGRSDFQGLRRVANTTTAVTTAISAAGGLIAEQ